MMRCMSALLSLLTVSVWLQLVYEMVEVKLSFSLHLFHSTLSGKPSELHKNCLEEVQAISCATLFSPVMRVEAVQSMSEPPYIARLTLLMWYIVLVSGWSDNGWLSGGHAVRMAMELCKLSLFC